MNILATADLHLSDLPQDEHRWGLFPWLVTQAKKYGVGMIVLAGDITQNKNNHSAALTNKMVASLRMLAAVAPTYVLRGNHDYIDEAEPFFGFVSGFKHLTFVTKPLVLADNADERQILMLPNTRNYQDAWKDLNFNQFDLIFCHQTFDGAISEMGDHALTGIPPSVFGKTKAQVYSGDIHKAQRLNKTITYIGSPYRTRFGETHDPRVLLIREDGKTTDLRFPTKDKLTVDLLDWQAAKTGWGNLLAAKGDQVKVRVHMPRSAYPEWPEVKRKIVEESAKLGIELYGPELIAVPDQPQKAPAKGQAKPVSAAGPIDALRAYAAQKRLAGPLLKAGEAFLKEASK